MPMIAGGQDGGTQHVIASNRRPKSTNRSDIKPVLLLTVFCALLFGSGLATIPVLDRVEARFAQAAFQMLSSGDFWAISFQDQPRTKKPHGIYWLQAASVWAFSTIEAKAIWAYRLPSAICAWIAVLFCYLLGRDLFDRRSGFLAAMLMAATPVLIAEAHIATADSALLACVAVAYWALARSYLTGQEVSPPGIGVIVLFWSAVCGAALMKGLIGPGVIALGAVTLCIIERRLSPILPLWPLTGTVLVIAVISAWAWRAGLSHPGGFASEALGIDFLVRLMTGQESRGALPGIHALIALAALGPALPFTLLGLFAAYRNWQLPAARFCIAWVAPAWIVFELVSTKLPHYTLPLYPALILLAGWRLGLNGTADYMRVRATVVVWAAITTAIPVAVIGYLTIPAWQPGLASVDILALSLIVLSASLATIYFGASDRPRAAIGMAITSITVTAICAATYTMPHIKPFWISDRIAEAVRNYGVDQSYRLVSVGYHEPSLVFTMGTDTALVTDREAARLAAGGENIVFAIEDRWRAAFERQTVANGGELGSRTTVTGFNYSSGRWLNIWLYFP